MRNKAVNKTGDIWKLNIQHCYKGRHLPPQNTFWRKSRKVCHWWDRAIAINLHCSLNQDSSTLITSYTRVSLKQSYLQKKQQSSTSWQWVKHRTHLSSSSIIEPSSATFTRGTRSGPSWLSSPFSASSSSSSSWSGVLFSSCLQYYRAKNITCGSTPPNCCSVCQMLNNLINHLTTQPRNKLADTHSEICFSFCYMMDKSKTVIWKARGSFIEHSHRLFF